MMRMKTKTTGVALSELNGSSGSGGNESGPAEWELRPGGMLVQKRNPDSDRNIAPPPTIRVRVKYGSIYHEINISAQSSFGDLKKMLAGPTGLHHQDQKLIFKDKERDSKAFLDMSGVKDVKEIELFRRELFGEPQEIYDDPVFNVSCTREHLSHDLLLLENQLPWSVLECLYNLTANFPSQQVSLTSLVLNFFRQSPADELMLNYSFRLPRKIFHILDLVRTVMVNGFEEKLDEYVEKKRKKNEPNLPQRIPNATSLSKAGIQFRSSQRKEECIMNIEFNKNGVFTIPLLAIDERTEPLFRNLIAFEQCHHNRPHKITSYAVLMDNLIDSREDVDFLSDKGILANWLNADDAAQFFNKLYNDTTVEYYYSDLSDNVNEYYKSKWHRFMEILRSDYFSTPWRIISFIAAFILLVLTLVQTLYAIQWP